MFAAALFVCAFASCSNLGGDDYSSQVTVTIPTAGPTQDGTVQTQTQPQGFGAGDLCAKVAVPNLPTVPKAQEISASSAEMTEVAKSALPDMSVIGINYTFTAMLSGGGSTYSATGEYDSSTGECQFVFVGAARSAATVYTLSVSLNYKSGSSTTVAIASGSKQVTLAANADSFAASVKLAPNTDCEINGNISLPLEFADAAIDKVEMYLWNSAGEDVAAASFKNVLSASASPAAIPISGASGTLESVDGGLHCGSYTLAMTFYKGSAKCGSRTESLNVYPTLTTSVWWSAGGTGTAGDSLAISTTTQTEYWVRGTGGDFYANIFKDAPAASDTGSGTFAEPFETLQAAISAIQATGDASTKYTIVVDGLVNAAPSVGYASNDDSMGNISLPCKITLKGWSGSDTDILDAAAQGRVLSVANGATVTLQDIALKNGNATVGGCITTAGTVTMQSGLITGGTATAGAGVSIASTGAFTLKGGTISANNADASGGLGGAFCALGQLDIYGGEISGNSSYQGGAIYCAGTVTMNKGDMTGNSAANGGAVYITKYGESAAKFTLSDGNISSNSVKSVGADTGLGAGIFNYDGTLDIKGGLISDNTGAENGGGVYNMSAATMSGGTISGNSATNSGGGVHTSNSFTMSGGTISGNTASFGGGVIINDNSFEISHGTIEANTASSFGGGVFVSKSTAQLAIKGDCEIRQNSSRYGAGVYSCGISTMSGGKITANTAASNGSGGGVYIYDNSFTMTGGEISANTAPLGGAAVVEFITDTEHVTHSGEFHLSGNVSIPVGTTKNDVYLYNPITIDGDLAEETLISVTPRADTTNPETYTPDFVVLFSDDDGTLVKNNRTHFAVLPDAEGNEWSISSEGLLRNGHGVKTGAEINSILTSVNVNGVEFKPSATPEPASGVSHKGYLDYEETIPIWYDSLKMYYYAKGVTDGGGNKILLNKNSAKMFKSCSNYVAISTAYFDTSKVENMSEMFHGCTGVTSLDVSGFDTGKVKDMSQMFEGCSQLASLDIASLDTSNVTDMSAMFHTCSALAELKINGIDTSKVTNMYAMFSGCNMLTQLDVSGFDTSSVTTMEKMFYNCNKVTELDFTNWDVSKVTSMEGAFSSCTKLERIFASTKTSYMPVALTKTTDMFSGCTSLKGGCGTACDGTTHVSDISYMTIDRGSAQPGYLTDKSMLKTGLDINIDLLFVVDSTITAIKPCATKPADSVDKRYIDYAKEIPIWADGTDVFYYVPAGEKLNLNPNSAAMFESFTTIQSIDLSGFDTSAVETMEKMFNNCRNATQFDLSGFDTGKVTNMTKMFYNCLALETIYVNSTKFDVAHVTASDNMFGYCSSLKGGSSTTCDGTTNIDVTYARVDNPPSQPGYFTGDLRPVIVIDTPDGKLTLSSDLVGGEITSSATDTIVTISATDQSGTAVSDADLTSWTINVYNGPKELGSVDSNSFKFKRAFPKGTYTMNVSVVYKGTPYSDSFTVQKTVDGVAPVTGTPLTFEAIEAGATVSFDNKAAGSVYYSVNGGDLTEIAAGDTGSVTLDDIGDIVEFYGDNAQYATDTSSYSNISCDKECYVYGNIMSLVSSDDFESQTELTKDYTFFRLFSGNENIINKSGMALRLPATKLKKQCYQNMFNGCKKLTKAPALSATSLANSCYASMFSGCKALVEAPELSATTLMSGCYNGMFQDCESLVEAPALPAMSAVTSCYANMFKNCKALVEAPDLPATTVKGSCYASMFEGCSSLVKAPAILPATGITSNSSSALGGQTQIYQYMFKNCEKLTKAPQLPSTTVTNYCYKGMFEGCTSLVDVPDLPAENLGLNGGMYSYQDMFKGCTALVNAPKILATKMGKGSCTSMFEGCESLVKAPALPATTLAANCYDSMFRYCKNLTEAPILAATTLVSACYSQMFEYCESLGELVCLAEVDNAGGTAFTSNWLVGVRSSGTFYASKNVNLLYWMSDVPEGWTRNTYSE